MKLQHRWIVVFVVVVSAYVGYVGPALRASLAQLSVADATLSGRAPTAQPPVSLLAERGASARLRPDVAPPNLPPADATAPASISRAAGEPDWSAADATMDDASVLRQRALVEIAAHPEFAELLDSRGAAVREAVLDFFEDE